MRRPDLEDPLLALVRVASALGCPECGGSGLQVDAYLPGDLTDDEVAMLDSTRCYACHGDGLDARADG